MSEQPAESDESPGRRAKSESNDIVITANWNSQPGARVNIYGSLVKDRGFGQITGVPVEGNEVEIHFVPGREPSRYFFRLTTGNAWGESPAGEVLVVPNTLYLQGNFKPLKESTTNLSEVATLSEKERTSFRKGRTIISFETGLDPAATVDVYILGKVASGQSINPSLKMDGEPGVLFKKENSAPRFALPDIELPSRAKLEITPSQVRAVSVSDKVVFFWDTSACSNYSGIKVFRSRERRMGDFADVGEKVFDGFGSTNAFELERMPEASLPASARETAPDFQKFADLAPVDPQPAVTTTQRAAASGRPAPPQDLSVRLVEKIEGFTHLLDTPPQRDVVFTYTLYAFDRAGNQSYPIVVNAALDSSATNCIFRLLK